jgi:predicted TIM-barrel fold metal-dependent hydrolase
MPDTSAHANSEKNSTRKRPNFTVPLLACDTHFHVFGLPEHYPYGPELRYTPLIALLSEYLTLSEHLNIESMVFVQPSAYGKDNTCMLDAMAKMGERCRGIVDIEENMLEQEFERFHAIGVRGIRINVAPIKSYEAGFAEKIIARVKPLAKRIKTFGWHLQFLSPGWLVNELIPTLEKLPVPFVIDHIRSFRDNRRDLA